MPREIKPIRLPLPLKMGTVNCYLVTTGRGCVLIDTGGSNQRGTLEKELAGAGCRPDGLDLIVITHGDFDHIGNAAYLRQRFGAKIAMHRDDAGMAERGDMSWNRKKGGFVLRTLVPLLFRFAREDRFSPDLYLEDGDDLSAHGFDARVLHLPGHSSGSIGVLAGDGLFCGDLLDNTKRPALNAIMDDPAAAQASLEKLLGHEIQTVYPGHGESFPLEAFRSALKSNGQEEVLMKALVVYDSVYGNTEKIARAIGDALGIQGEVQTVRVSEIKPGQLAGITLLVVGSPTQKFSPLPATTRFLKDIPQGGLQGVRVAAFDTRITEEEVERVRILAFFVRIFGYAAEPILKRLEKKGGKAVVPAEGFYVEGTEGPLLEGELERAADWAGKLLAAQ